MASWRFGVPPKSAGGPSFLRSAACLLFGHQILRRSKGPAPTVDSVNTDSSSQAPKEPPVTAQPEVVAEFNQTEAAALNTAPSSPRASPLRLISASISSPLFSGSNSVRPFFTQPAQPFFPSPLTSTATLPSSIPTQTLQSCPNPTQPSNSAFGPSYLSAAQKAVPSEPLSYGSISLSGSIPEVLFFPPEVPKISEDLKYALIGKFSFG
ncbi:SWIB/MDM2 domain superfamily protein [Striga asiatica]|uniref:SWIB/MDM2 domain superfamily protein n=1 Tax=Striga asiatica TaxID=4170 RepID=A0A5A7PBI8_STRAF|nr:SWIB/MDM2 domain superfamily protein [Striga asiatica]